MGDPITQLHAHVLRREAWIRMSGGHTRRLLYYLAPREPAPVRWDKELLRRKRIVAAQQLRRAS